jgi:hypothetical protein
MYHYDCFYICKDLTEGEINQSIKAMNCFICNISSIFVQCHVNLFLKPALDIWMCCQLMCGKAQKCGGCVKAYQKKSTICAAKSSSSNSVLGTQDSNSANVLVMRNICSEGMSESEVNLPE